tara:strand:- start:88 stop:219 length:132 start_codon:yes stop_codon:yes gene_type:complete
MFTGTKTGAGLVIGMVSSLVAPQENIRMLRNTSIPVVLGYFFS